MTPTALDLLLGVAGVVLAVVLLPFAIVRARRAEARAERVPASVLLPPLVLGALLVAGVALLVAAVVLG